jgi:ferredoxin--NADP+ reductase
MIGAETQPLRVAIIGSGPSAFYAAASFFKRKGLAVQVDMYDRLPTPYGLVRGGVAPDHQKIKSVVRAYERTAKKAGFRFFGNVEYGTDITLEDLKQHYHQVCFCVGAQTDKPLRIPGIDLKNSYAATEFVAWYNGHPDYRHLTFDLEQESVAVIGVGNVAMDVARILCRTTAELETTDIADYALEALRASKVKEVYVLGRRGPAQAAFTNPEISEMGELADTDVVVLRSEGELDPLSKADLKSNGDRSTRKKVKIIQSYIDQPSLGRSRKMIFRFLVSPTEIVGNDDGEVHCMKIVKNELYLTDRGGLRPRATSQIEDIPVGLVFTSIGYRGVPLADVPFFESWGIVPNLKGRITEAHESEQTLPGMYVAGWIKRGPSGVIGTNRPDAVETVDMMLEDLENGLHFNPDCPDRDAAAAMVAAKQPRFVSFDDWLKLDAIEVERGQALGRPRLKFTETEEMLQALGK